MTTAIARRTSDTIWRPELASPTGWYVGKAMKIVASAGMKDPCDVMSGVPMLMIMDPLLALPSLGTVKENCVLYVEP